MEVVENTLDADLDAVLDRPLFCFLAQTSPAGPRVSPLWYSWEEGSIWMIATRSRSYHDRIEADGRTALAIVDFDPAIGRVNHVGMRGQATIRPFDADRADRIIARYLGDVKADWPERFTELPAGEHALIRFDPETVVVRDQSYPAP